MYFKIAFGNVKKSFKDYSIYFFTLTLAVSVFYSFNSIESQKALLELNKSTASYIDTLSDLIGVLSIFVSVILGSLILYANNFLIKKRKKELGIYMTLGMGKSKISKILVLETIIVGIASLISGMLIGFIISQGLSAFTSNLFDINMSEYKFMISTSAIMKTIIYFGIIFLIVMIFNSVVISKYKIIDLLTANHKNESIKLKNPLVYLITFILCILTLGFSYKFVIDVGLDIKNPKFIVSIVFGIIGTVLFFYSLAGSLLYIVKKNKNIYFKDLNIFIVKQLNSKINTNFISVSVICLMLFLTIGILSTGISFKNALESSLKNTTPFDASAIMYVTKGEKIQSIKDALDALDFKFDKSDAYVYYDIYNSNLTINDIFEKDITKSDRKTLNTIVKQNIEFIKISDYNNIRKLDSKNPVDLENNKIILMSNNNTILNIVDKFLKRNNDIKINGENYTIQNKKVLTEALHSTGLADNFLTLVVEDSLTNNLPIQSSNLNINFKDDYKNSEEKFSKLFKKYKENKLSYDKFGFINGSTKEEIYANNKGSVTIILFSVIYLGIVFLISSMAVLALQQLSEASESIDRYKALKKIGANDKMINKSIFVQTLIYFSLPVSLAFIHSIIGIKVVSEFIAMYDKPDIGGSSLMTAIIFLIIYIGYFYATYTGYKNIVKSS
ncbi:FtsX-like permease family protein [Paraclostridium sordellii]|uniref:FtsX-like permease family protein n=1 Tax=Paraclostridium sordellii TaxID=1505 RepID=UPI0005E43F5D|nr:ABC transporter permease [Paeniclostridium sordellii]CEN25555.1 ABC transporter [[Clostridium] sordellii] [Paeniclostridium sordellii]